MRWDGVRPAPPGTHPNVLRIQGVAVQRVKGEDIPNLLTGGVGVRASRDSSRGWGCTHTAGFYERRIHHPVHNSVHVHVTRNANLRGCGGGGTRRDVVPANGLMDPTPQVFFVECNARPHVPLSPPTQSPSPSRRPSPLALQLKGGVRFFFEAQTSKRNYKKLAPRLRHPRVACNGWTRRPALTSRVTAPCQPLSQRTPPGEARPFLPPPPAPAT